MLDAVFHGAPNSLSQPGGSARTALDVNSGVLYYQAPNVTGWQSVAGSGSSGGLNVTSAASPSIPSPLYTGTTESPATINPFIYVQDVNGQWHTQAGIDINTVSSVSGPPPPAGTLTWTRRMFFRDNLSATQSGKNAFLSINHTLGLGTVQVGNQDRAIWASMTNLAGTSTSFSITNNVVTINIPSNPFLVGQVVVPTNFATGTYLNGQQLTILTSGSTFITAAFTHADVGLTADTANIDQFIYSMTCFQAELDIVGSQFTFAAAPDTELNTISLQCSDAHTGSATSPGAGVGCIRAQYFRQANAGAWGSGEPAAIRVITTNNSAVNANGMILDGISVTAVGGVNANNCNWRGILIIPPTSNDRFTNNWGLYVNDFGSNAADYAIYVAGGQTYLGGPLLYNNTQGGFGNGAAATAVTTTAVGTGGGPATAQTVVRYLKVKLDSTVYWIPLMQ